ncbi:MAG TPA: hypothetical protein VEN29_13000 [Casimicrobiaceae bacterium]|nr:hypothetical protein [Casimicrobiaceae bacterium]
MIRRHRALRTLLLSLLLLGMQLQAHVHAIGHVGEMLQHSAGHSLVVSVSDACAMCALLAGGSSAIACDAPDVHVPIASAERSTCAPASLAPAAPSYYFSRAPPSLL